MKKCSLFVFASLLSLVLFACGQESDTIKFGFIAPMSEEYSVFKDVKGAMLAAEEINAKGGILGKTLEIISYDSKGDSEEGIKAYNTLVNDYQVNAIVGGKFSRVSLAFKELAIKEGIPVLSPTSTNPNVTLNAPNIFRVGYTDTYQGEVVAKFAMDELNVKKAAVYYNPDDAYSEGLALAFVNSFEFDGSTVDAFTFSMDTEDHSATLAQIKLGAYEFVFIPTQLEEAGHILTHVATLDFGATKFMGGDAWDGIETDHGSVVEGYYFSSAFVKTDSSPQVQAFVEKFNEKFNEDPSSAAALSYDAIYVLAAAIEAANSVVYADVVLALQNLTYDDAVTGSIHFNQNGDPQKSVTIIQILQGKYSVVKKLQN